MDGRTLTNRLADEGILVRYYNTPRLKNCVRISVGRPEQNDIVLGVLREIAAELTVILRTVEYHLRRLLQTRRSLSPRRLTSTA